jgi:hypothetical protein
MIKFYYRALDAVRGAMDTDAGEQPVDPYAAPNKNRHYVETPDTFAIARWPRDADVSTICRCILGTLKYEPHAADVTGLRRALESVIEHTAREGSVGYEPKHPNGAERL